MKVILLSNIEKVGHKGDIVNVKRGFARNYLIPRNHAIYATPANMSRLSSIQSKAAEEEAQHIAELQKIAEILNSNRLTFIRKVDEHDHMFGSVSESDISAALSDKGMSIHKSAIHMEKHIKELGESSVLIRLHKDVQATLIVIVAKEGGNDTQTTDTPIPEQQIEPVSPLDTPTDTYEQDIIPETPADDDTIMPEQGNSEASDEINPVENNE